MMVGRADEQGVVGAAVRRALAGGFAAVLVSGDAGVGKTTLVRAAAARAAPDALVLSGACLPMTSVAVPLLGLRSAVRSLEPERRPRVLSDAGVAGQGGGGGPTGTRHPVPLEVDAWLSELCSEQPVVLCVDDLHWADPETLDTLMYVLAGPSDRALAVLVTHRASEVGAQHPMRRWVADVRRLPGVTDLALGPLAREETNHLVTTVLGAVPHVSLVDEVHTRSAGNPYLVELLLQGVAPSARGLPPSLPDGIVPAVARAWFSLPVPAQRLVGAIAAGGHPIDDRALDRLAVVVDVPEPHDAIVLAVAAGLLEADAEGRLWFHHPLQAEALETSLRQDERRALHAALALEAAAALRAGARPGGGLAATVSDHFALADDPASAYSWSVEAARRLEGADDSRQRLRMLRRAVALRDLVPGAEESLDDLLTQTVGAAAAVADSGAQIEAIDGLLDLVDDTKDPLRRATLLAERARLRFSAGRGRSDADLARALELTVGHPGTWQRLVVLAECVGALLWEEDVERATEVSRTAMAELEEAGEGGAESGRDGGEWRRAAARVLSSAAMLAIVSNDPDGARGLGGRAADLAYASGEMRTLVEATFWESEAETSPTRQCAGVFARRRGQLVELGAPQGYVGWLCACEAGVWLAR